MKVKKVIVIFFVICILINTFSALTTRVYASSRFEEMIEEADNFTDESSVGTTIPIQVTMPNLQKTSKIISGLLLVVAIGVAIVTIVTVGINLMVQSAEEKAKTKESLVPLVVGMFISFGAYGIWKVMVGVFAKL